ncbi:hypothetical protein K505DRAFT_330959 [Melanomma pulvis-pyrius CBS 109.77]|uniref:Uncharacterized protein n=1 Tax=Melanomma pulvis-pyrius CBS 109.77 TaxID=1314802 RepID=A0A6A6WNI7_9PLEO|nr:hypothetical protein K505DRAFT_330959 [Melanomma pulvis-pyrius CBS 109.77]
MVRITRPRSLRLVEGAAKGGGSANWGAEGLHFAEAGWSQISAQEAQGSYDQGFTESTEVDPLRVNTSEYES